MLLSGIVLTTYSENRKIMRPVGLSAPNVTYAGMLWTAMCAMAFNHLSEQSLPGRVEGIERLVEQPKLTVLQLQARQCGSPLLAS